MKAAEVDWTAVVIGLVLLSCPPLFILYLITWCVWPRKGEKR